MFLKCLKTVDSIRKQVIIILRYLCKIISELPKTAKAMIISVFMNFFYYMYRFNKLDFCNFSKMLPYQDGKVEKNMGKKTN